MHFKSSLIGAFQRARPSGGEQGIRLSEGDPDKRYRQVFDNSSDALFIVDVEADGTFRFNSLNAAAEQAFGLPGAMLRGLSFNEILDGRLGFEFGSALAENVSSYRECVATGMPAEYESPLDLLPERRGDCRRFRVQLLPLAGDGGIERIIAIAHDITLRKQYESELRQRARLEEQLSALATMVPGFLFTFRATPDGRRSFPFASPGVEKLFGLRPADIQDDADVLYASYHAEDRAKVSRLMEDATRGVAPFRLEARVMHPDKGLRWVEIRAMPQQQADGAIEWHGLMIDVTARKQTEWKLIESRALLQQLSVRREEARDDERKRIARDLHEELGQVLTALRMRISTLPLQFGAIPGLGESAEAMIRLVDRGIHGMRDVISSLRPASLDAGIAAGLEWLVCEFVRHAGFECGLHLPQQRPELTESQATGVFRIVQEALTNAARHSGARRVDVVLERLDGRWRLEVRDDGRGCGGRKPSSRSFGILGMSERALMLGGEFEIDSPPGGGTVIRVSFPAS